MQGSLLSLPAEVSSVPFSPHGMGEQRGSASSPHAKSKAQCLPPHARATPRAGLLSPYGRRRRTPLADLPPNRAALGSEPPRTPSTPLTSPPPQAPPRAPAASMVVTSSSHSLHGRHLELLLELRRPLAPPCCRIRVVDTSRSLHGRHLELRLAPFSLSHSLNEAGQIRPASSIPFSPSHSLNETGQIRPASTSSFPSLTHLMKRVRSDPLRAKPDPSRRNSSSKAHPRRPVSPKWIGSDPTRFDPIQPDSDPTRNEERQSKVRFFFVVFCFFFE